jgi:hypothetical protein
MNCIHKNSLLTAYVWDGSTNNDIIAEEIMFGDTLYHGRRRGFSMPYQRFMLVKIGEYIVCNEGRAQCVLSEEGFRKYYHEIEIK